MLRTLTAVAALSIATPVWADDITDTLNSAIEAYEQGDIAYALEEIAFATQLMKQLNAGTLTQLLPAAQDGWTQDIDVDEARALGAMGGTGAVAHYSNGGDEFTIQIMVDSPIIAGFAGIFGNAAVMASMGEVMRVGREKFLNNDGELTAVIGGRILVQGMGSNTDAILAHLKAMDFNALKAFGT